jgi:hypothetical protein
MAHPQGDIRYVREPSVIVSLLLVVVLVGLSAGLSMRRQVSA